MRKTPVIAFIGICSFLVPVMGYSIVDVRRQLEIVARRPPASCITVAGFQLMAVDQIRQDEVDHGLIVYILAKHHVRNRWLFVGAYNTYLVTLHLVASANQRRDLFSRLPCGVRPKLLPKSK
jgi:hypothetical protein